MARSHGKILVDVWLGDFTCLNVREQWTYFMLLSQPKLTLVGSLDYRPNHWSQHANDIDTGDVDDSVRLLEATGYVVVDRTTEELLIRSMTKHDGLRTGNPKLLQGLWTAWKGIASRSLREVAVVNMPASLFGHECTPEAAEEIRRSAQTDRAIGWSIGSPSDRPIVPPSYNRLPTSTAGQCDSESSLPVDFGHRPVPKLPPEKVDENVANVRALKRKEINHG
jgi:hypothetical protein